MSSERRLLRCELRGEKKLYGLAALTVAFATAALALALALGDTFEKSFAASAKTLLGGDVSVRLRQRDFLPEEQEWLRQNAREVSFVRVVAVMAIAGEESGMARVKVADNAYPLYGEFLLKDGDQTKVQELLSAGADSTGAYPAAVDESLMPALGIKLGDTLQAAGLTLRISALVSREPDPDSRMWMTMPLILAGSKVEEGGEFSSPGMLSSRHARVLLPEGETGEEWIERLNTAFPEAEWRARVSQRAMPGLRRFVNRMRDFLSLMALAAMFAAGIGIGGAMAAFLRARVRAIAVVKMLGGARALVARVYLKIASLFIVGGALMGAFAGSLLLFWAAPYLSSSLPLSLSPQWPWMAFAKSFFSALLMGCAFVVPPALRAARTNPLTLFKAGGNEQDSPPYSRRDFTIGAIVWVFTLLLLPLGLREKIAALCILAAAGVLYGLSILCAHFAGTMSRRVSPAGAWGLAAVARNRKQTAAGVVSLGVAMALLIATLNIKSNFAARIDDTLRQQAPTFYLMGVRQSQGEPLREMLKELNPDTLLRTIPFLRGKIKSLGGRAAEDIDAPSDKRWILSGSRGITWTEDGSYIGASEVTKGELWDKNETRPQASFDEEAAAAFGIGVGDELVLNILGEPLTVVITSLREINWQSFDINFVIILDRQPFGSAPFSLMGAAFMPPDAEAEAKIAIPQNFPNVTPIAMSTVFDIGRRLLENISLLLQAAAAFMLAGTIPAVVASLMDGQRRRTHDAVTLRLLGAPLRSLVIKGVAEFAAIAATALLPALFFGLAASWFVVENIFELPWEIGMDAPLIALGGGVLFLILGAANIVKWVRQPPLALLRNE